jgi:hypothetical protein
MGTAGLTDSTWIARVARGAERRPWARVNRAVVADFGAPDKATEPAQNRN